MVNRFTGKLFDVCGTYKHQPKLLRNLAGYCNTKLDRLQLKHPCYRSTYHHDRWESRTSIRRISRTADTQRAASSFAILELEPEYRSECHRSKLC